MIKNDSQGPSCTCPSGDGSLVHPCPAHPAQTQPSPAPTLRAAIDVANDRFEVPVAKWGTDLAGKEERPEVVAYFDRNYPSTGDAFIWSNYEGSPYEPVMTVAQHDRIAGTLRADAQRWREQFDCMQLQRNHHRDRANAAQARVAELESATSYIEVRQCVNCRHIGINDAADYAACHDCRWTGPEPDEDKCPGCAGENCMAAACPECGGRYELVAEANIATPVAQAGQVPQAWLDVQAERRRQVENEGWTPEHDDEHADGQMAQAAGCYALHAGGIGTDWPDGRQNGAALFWPWDRDSWKPTTPRRDLVKACALALAEIERLDRACISQSPQPGATTASS
ncbi:TPA: hypothetical protein ACXJAB_001747 [Pseudomonas aeruginosa]